VALRGLRAYARIRTRFARLFCSAAPGYFNMIPCDFRWRLQGPGVRVVSSASAETQLCYNGYSTQREPRVDTVSIHGRYQEWTPDVDEIYQQDIPLQTSQTNRVHEPVPGQNKALSGSLSNLYCELNKWMNDNDITM